MVDNQYSYLWWRYKVERYRRFRKSGRWTTVDCKTSTQPFYINDGTDHCLIDPQGTDFDCRQG